ncbi:MAG: hypothetical protein FWC62_05345 [Firmicutes bacterium]|nr:hypothetical protein [Bacillota bacterium]
MRGSGARLTSNTPLPMPTTAKDSYSVNSITCVVPSFKALLQNKPERIENYMADQEKFKFFVDQLLENAVKEFQATEQYKLLREKLDRMDRDCDMMFTKDEKDFAEECFELISDAGGREEYYVYRKGLSDSVKVLKGLGVLA